MASVILLLGVLAAGPPGMVWIPGGTFEMGGDVYPEEGPFRVVTVRGVWMDEHEVTNAQFARFVAATGYRPMDGGVAVFQPVAAPDGELSWWKLEPDASWEHPRGPSSSIAGRASFPVIAVTFADAVAYARWKGGRLPTEAEWEWAARGGEPRAERGHHGPPRHANTWQGDFPLHDTGADGHAGLAPVKSYAPSALGLFDMIGNVWEWTATAAGPRSHLIKGGSYLCAPTFCRRYRAGARQAHEDDLGTTHLGFRTVLDGPPPGFA